jgi:hypothetical protein
VIGGQGVNAYVEPLVRLDLDIAVATADRDRTARLLGDSWRCSGEDGQAANTYGGILTAANDGIMMPHAHHAHAGS